MKHKSMFVLSLLVIFSLFFSLISSAQAQDSQPPQRVTPPLIYPQYPHQYPQEEIGVNYYRWPPSLSTGMPNYETQTAVSLGQPGLSFRYVRTLGQTEEPYLDDHSHLNFPVGLAVDQTNGIIIVEERGRRLLKFDQVGTFELKIGIAGVGFNSDYSFDAPKDAVVDADNNIWVAEANRIVKYAPDGSYLLQFPAENSWESGDDNGHFNWVSGIAFDASGRLFVSDSNNQRIQVFVIGADDNPVWVKTIGVTGEIGSDNNHFNYPERITVANQQLLIADAQNHRVQIYDVSSPNPAAIAYIATIGQSGIPGNDNDHLDYPFGVAANSSYILISEGNNNRVQLFNASTRQYITTVLEFGTTPGSIWNPRDVALDAVGNLYVADSYNHRVQLFSKSTGPNWSYSRMFGTSNVPYLTDTFHFNKPRVAIDNNNNIIVLEEEGQRLMKFDNAGNLIFEIGTPGIERDSNRGTEDNLHFSWPHGVAADKNGNIYVADNNRVQIYSSAGSYTNTIGGNWGSGNYEFQWATGLAVDRNNGNIYVADGPNQRVQVYNSNRTYVATIGETGIWGADNGHFNYPIGVEVDSGGNIYVADINNCRVQKFNSSRIYLTTFGTTGSCTNSFSDLSSEDVTVDANGRVYVSGWDNRVQVFDKNTSYLTTIGGMWGSSSSQFRGASGVAVDGQGNVYVSDFTNGRIQIFTPGVPGWQQANINGFGNPRLTQLTTLEGFNNYLYVGTSNYEEGIFHIWRSADGQTWQEMGHDFQAGISALASFSNKLFAATWAGDMWSSSDGSSWMKVYSGTSGFASLSKYNNTLYAGTYSDDGTTILKTTDGVTWDNLVTNGNGDPNAGGAISAATFEGNQYFGVADWTGSQGARIWRFDGADLTPVVDDGFGDPGNLAPGGIASFNGNIYVSVANPINSFQVWKSDSGDAGTWTESFEGGLGEPGDKSRSGLIVFNAYLYLTVQNDVSGMQVWRTADGATWELVGDAGFGDSNNGWTEWSSGLEIFNNELYISTHNYASGGEIWRPVVPIDVKIGGSTRGKYTLPYRQSNRKNYTGLNSGPVEITSTDNNLTIASQRVLFGGVSYSEMMGLPAEQLTKEYLFPYYNNVAMDSQLRVSNVGGAETTITVYLGTNKIDEYTLTAGGATRKNYTGRNGGPLRVTSSASDILATIRVLYGGKSYSELMGLPAGLLTKEYLFPYYNNVAMDSQLRVSNVGGAETTITVYLGSNPDPIDQYTLAAGGASRKNYSGRNSGPLRVTSSASDILTTIRVLYGGSSYSELMGFPTGQLGQEYWYPVYDNAALDSQLRVSNVGTDTTHITIYAGGTLIDSYDLSKGGAVRKNYPKNTGPLQVVSSTQPILTTIRMLFAGSSYYEMTGLPQGQLSTRYFFPWYNNTAMSSELRFAVP